MKLCGFMAHKGARDAPSLPLSCCRSFAGRCEVTRSGALLAEQLGEHLRGMVAWIDLVIHAFDAPASVDEEAHPLGIPCLEALASTVGERDLVRGIAEQPEA